MMCCIWNIGGRGWMHGWCATFRRLCSECVEWWSLCMMSEEDRQSIRNQLEEYEERKKKWYLDVKSTPCARDALVHGIMGGIAIGLLYFAKSSIVMKSCNMAVGGFALISLGSWEYCRYQKAKQRLEVKRTVNVLNALNKMSSGGGPTTWQPQQMTDNESDTKDTPG